ncbi:MAG: LemA family protein [Fibrobacter sp.]|nr:LemA family protein [Fibrobacter sp.]
MKSNSKVKVLVTVGVILGIIMALGLKVIGWKNHLVDLDEQVKKSWANIENQLQRRMELIPNLVETVKGYASHESDVLVKVTEARASVAGASTLKEQVESNNQLTSALSRLLVVVEKYPELKANENFRDLQDELTGTDNRISVERKRYNDAVNSFNSTRRKIPYSFFAGDFPEAAYFEAAPEAKAVPKVSF